MASKASTDGILVVGLGRFGGQVAASLIRLGHEVLAIDEDEQIVQKWADRLTHVVQADATDEDALRQLGVGDLRRAIVGIGTEIEASVLSVLTLNDLGVRDLWAKAISAKHGKILSAVGADHVIYPEAAMGERVAHLIASQMLDFIEFDDGYAMAKVQAPTEAIGRTLGDSKLRSKYGVTVVAVKMTGSDFTYARPETMVYGGALLIVAGKTPDVERFSSVT
ncbi:potassium channel family protein [Natronosporangium hydrolyticum]|uniref:potassium channel family protein n=1 Tax=Natronosporangium hydrolyticum TaxID=2811111 RepID=UPI001EFA1965|nr:TrkA family potassium uptake protein [Natronosporangium hydrolyticum]